VRSGKLHAWELEAGDERARGMERACWDADGARSVLARTGLAPRAPLNATSVASVRTSRRAWEHGWQLGNLPLEREFYAAVPTDAHLLFQVDGLLCGRGAERARTLESFLGFALVGAPWFVNRLEGAHGGNGGLALRQKAPILRVLEAFEPAPFPADLEDMFLSRNLPLVGGSLPSDAAAALFSVETVCVEAVTRLALGFHKVWAWTSTHGEAMGGDDGACLRSFVGACPVARIAELLVRLDAGTISSNDATELAALVALERAAELDPGLAPRIARAVGERGVLNPFG